MRIESVEVPEGRSGDYSVERFTVSEQDAKFSTFSYSGRYVTAGTYTRLRRGRTVVMSDTPAERRDHAYFVSLATGSVLVNGLGLGMCIKAVLAKDDVAEVTVIEKSPDVIRLVAPALTDPRLTIIEADALAWQPPKGKRYDAVWHDIWDNICADNLPDMHKLHRKYGRRTDWQGSWCRAECERQSREWKRERRFWR